MTLSRAVVLALLAMADAASGPSGAAVNAAVASRAGSAVDAVPVFAVPARVGAGAVAFRPAPAGASPPTVLAQEPPTNGFGWPVPPPPVVLTPFAPPPNRYGRGHRGVDLAGHLGEVVRAAGAGRVVYAGLLAGRGVVSIEHAGGLRTTYEPLGVLVRAGQQVATGTVIGRMIGGHAGCTPEVCVHWGARLPDGSYLDPMTLVTGWRVRLLPWDGSGSR